MGWVLSLWKAIKKPRRVAGFVMSLEWDLVVVHR